MKRITIAALALTFGIGLWASRAEAKVDYGDLLEYPAMKGQSAYTFLKIVTSPRAAGMGNAFTAVLGDVDAIFYNPGGLGFIKGGQYTFSYTRWLVNAKLYTGAVAYRMGGNVWGISVVSARPEAYEETTSLQPLGTGRTVQLGDLAIGLAFARQMTDRVSWGVQARRIQEDLFLKTSSTWNVDMGISAYTGYKSLRVAATLRNLGKEVTVETRPFSPPIYFNFGLSGELFGKRSDPSYLTLSLETLFATDYGQRWHLGGEYWIANALALRGGYRFNYDVEDYSLGLGLKHKIKDKDIRVDVSYSNGGKSFDAPLRFSLGGSF
ncbi:MAG: hypothetical protein A3F84_19285 [Candidatus Handelsmanbacteria bacterium RIFCSPLOWO2_12_FULL_64_10]|uniref:PorV/PorQ family protein n=1 Tax=Handelsmanbacteria sp. (strain RIFCSPLOWO2_12_FULL_64_10) TaxID=1817868 RepID=A0A1F6CZE4_HANXR|nr:MAG: hypothetical protein A3F84_19285 [Candidatus Handelsmanbacteria bacterium RIFCSPLOWO2_12_FULL_64_10]